MNRKWFKESDLETPDNPRGYHHKKRVAQIDVSTLNILKTFDSLVDANLFLGKKRGTQLFVIISREKLKKIMSIIGNFYKFVKKNSESLI